MFCRGHGDHIIEMHLPTVIDARLVVTDILQQLVASVVVNPISFIQKQIVPLKKVVHLTLVQIGIAANAYELCLADIEDLLLIILDNDVELQIVCCECGNLVFIDPFVSAKQISYPSLKREAATLLVVELPSVCLTNFFYFLANR